MSLRKCHVIALVLLATPLCASEPTTAGKTAARAEPLRLKTILVESSSPKSSSPKSSSPELATTEASQLELNGPASNVPTTNVSGEKLADERTAKNELINPANGEPTEPEKDVKPGQQRELVSILKRRLPRKNQLFEVKDAPEWFQNMMQRIVRENVPETYVYDKHWGKTERRWDGLDVERRGWKLHTERKWKEVNHGTWKRYEVTQTDPNENLKLRIENVRDAGNGKVGFDVRLASESHVMARMAKWTKGVQLYSISADADAAVEMSISCQVGMKLGLSFPPDVIFTPEVTAADLNIIDFRLKKVSKLDGPLIKKLSGSVRGLLLDKLEEKRDRLPEKINKQIAKNQDKMRLSLSAFVAGKKANVDAGNGKNDSGKAD